jgi:hypothetical protein
MNIIEQAKKDGTYVLMKSKYTAVPNWQDFLDNINTSFSEIKHKQEELDLRLISPNILVYNKLDPVVFNSLDLAHTTLYSKAEPVLSMVQEMMGKNHSGTKSIINFVGEEIDYWVHTDDHDVISWHCIGTVEWRFYKDTEGLELNRANKGLAENKEYTSVVLEPGDMLFVPKGLTHQVIIKEPRASLLFAFY